MVETGCIMLPRQVGTILQGMHSTPHGGDIVLHGLKNVKKATHGNRQVFVGFHDFSGVNATHRRRRHGGTIVQRRQTQHETFVYRVVGLQITQALFKTTVTLDTMSHLEGLNSLQSH